jgi:hypothetical protein
MFWATARPPSFRGSEEAPMIASERALKKCPSPEDTSLPPLMGAIPLALGNE